MARLAVHTGKFISPGNFGEKMLKIFHCQILFDKDSLLHSSVIIIIASTERKLFRQINFARVNET